MTVIPDWLPVIDGVTVSVAVNVLLPPATVLNVALELPVPDVSVEFDGSTAWASLDAEKPTVPAWPVAVLPNASNAVTVNEWLTPATVDGGWPDTDNDDAPAGVTVMLRPALLCVPSLTTIDAVSAL